MRSAQKSNRSRGRGNRKSSGGGNNLNRVYDSAGPEGKVRGTPQQIIDKYLSLARDAQTSGDRVASENFLQHAEHYQRILITATQAQAQEQPRRENGDTAQTQPQQANDTERDANDQPTPVAAAPIAAEQPIISGMDTIDAPETESESPLIVDAAEKPPTPRRNGAARGRNRRQDSAPAEAPELAVVEDAAPTAEG